MRRLGIDYDKFGRLSAYTQEWTTQAAPNKTESADWRAGSHDLLGELIDYYEDGRTILKDDAGLVISDVKTSNHRSDIQYTTAGQLKVYHEETERKYLDRPEIPSEFLTKDVSDTRYNELGQIEGNLEVTQKTYEKDGAAIVIRTQTTLGPAGEEMKYNSSGQVESYKEQTKKSVWLGAEQYEDTTIDKTWSSGTYNTFGQVEVYSERIVTASEDVQIKDRLETDVTTKRSDTAYNKVGLVSGYIDSVVNAAFNQLTTKVQMEDIGYDNLGRMTGYVEKHYEQALPVLDVLTTTIRSGIKYDIINNQLLEYHDTITSNAWPNKRIARDWSAGTNDNSAKYDFLDRLLGYRETDHITGIDENGQDRLDVLDVTTTTARVIARYQIDDESGLFDIVNGLPVATASAYNAIGQVAAFAETTTSTATPDLQTTLAQHNIKYDTAGRMTDFKEVTFNYHKDFASMPGAGPLFNYTMLEREIGVFDAAGNKVEDGYNELNQATDYRETIDGITLRTVRQTIYNSKGQINYYKENTIESDKDTIKNIKQNSGYPIPEGAHYVNVDSTRYIGKFQRNEDGSLALDKDGNPVQRLDKTGYDALGRIADYVEVSRNNSASPDLKATKVLEDTIYNKEGLTTGFKQSAIEQDIDWPVSNTLFVIIDTERFDSVTEFDALGQIRKYEDRTVNHSASPDLVTTINMDIRSFTKDGKMQEYIQIQTDQDKNNTELLNVTTTTHRWLGEYKLYKDEEGFEFIALNSDESPAEDATGAGYSDYGLIKNYYEKVTSTATAALVVLRYMFGIEYNSAAQQEKYKERTVEKDKDWSFGSGKLFVKTNTDRDDMEYNRLGRLKSYKHTDIIKRTEAPDMIIERSVDNIVNDVNDRRFSYHQEDLEYQWAEADPARRYKDKPGAEGIIINTDVYHQRTVTSRLLTTYDGKGRADSYVDVMVNQHTLNDDVIAASPDLTTTSIVTDTTYNSDNLRDSYSEEKREQKLDSPGNVTIDPDDTKPLTERVKCTIDATDPYALNLTTKIERSNMQYDDLGELGNLLVSYYDVQLTGQATGQKTTIQWGSESGDLSDRPEYGGIYDKAWGIESKDLYGIGKTVYDDKGRTKLYIEQAHRTIKDDNGTPEIPDDITLEDVAITTVRHVIAYNSLGKMTDYEEWVTSDATAELLTYRRVNNIRHNKKGQLVHQKEEVSEVDRDWTAGSDLYKVDTTTIRDIGVYSHNTDGSIIYDSNGELLGYNTLGQLTDYTDNIINNTRTPDLVENKAITLTYNALGQNRTYTEVNIETKIGAITEHYVKTTRTRGGINGEAGGIRYDTRSGKVIGYTEIVRREGENLDQTTTTTRTGLAYDIHGNVIYYQDEIIQDFAPDLVTFVYFGDDDTNKDNGKIAPTYDGFGLLRVSTEYKLEQHKDDILILNVGTKIDKTYFYDKTTGLLVKTTEVIDRDGQARQSMVREIGQLTGDDTAGYSIVVSGYDGIGQLIRYSDVITNLDCAICLKETVKFGNDGKDWVSPKYNTTGQLIEFYENKLEESTNSLKPLSVWATSHRYGNLNEAEFAYNNKGQILSYIDAQDREGQSITSTIRKVDGQTGYNRLGQLVRYTDIIANLEGAIDLETTVQFGNNGTNWVDATYDDKGRLADYYETKTENSANALYKLFVTTVTHRFGPSINNGRLFYDDQTGQMAAYVEEIAREGQARQRIERTIGDVTGVTINKSGYNELGQLLRYKDVITNLEAAEDLKTIVQFGHDKTDWVVPAYDNKGRLSSYNEYKEEKDIATNGAKLNIFTHTNRNSIAYDDQTGQMTGFTEIADRDGQSILQTQRQDAYYNSLGQIVYYHDTITNLEGALDLQTDVYFGDDDKDGLDNTEKDLYSDSDAANDPTKYDEYTRLFEYIEYKEEDDTDKSSDLNGDLENDDLTVFTAAKRTNILYDADGQMASYVDTSSKTADAEVVIQPSTTTTRTFSDYNTLGQLIYYKEEFSSIAVNSDLLTIVYFGDNNANKADNDPSIPLIGYDTKGRLLFYNEYREEKDIATGGNALDVFIRNLRNSITYDDITGQMLFYIDAAVNETASADLCKNDNEVWRI